MAYTLENCIEGLEFARSHFLKHIAGFPEEHWDSKLIPDSKSVRETVQHLISDDLATLESLDTGGDPAYETLQVTEPDTQALLALLAETRAKLIATLRAKYTGAPLDQEISMWGFPFKLAAGIAMMSSEDYYHAGQVTLVRTAMEPEWDYYAAVFG